MKHETGIDCARLARKAVGKSPAEIENIVKESALIATRNGKEAVTLKEISEVLKDNATVKVKIIGHTDSDGDDKSNLDLSKRRAASVKNALSTEFGIDASRMETDGKGESEPASANTTSEGKANNRRVEFIKL